MESIPSFDNIGQYLVIVPEKKAPLCRSSLLVNMQDNVQKMRCWALRELK
jgi:hypothetical protein